jgi:DNA-binding CsgD family transcriptional regulator
MASKKSAPRLNEKTAQILTLLKEGPLATKAIALALGLKHESVYSRCQRLEAKGQLKSDLVRARGAMYCVDDDKVVIGSEYQHCKAEDHDLRPTTVPERIWQLP